MKRLTIILLNDEEKKEYDDINFIKYNKDTWKEDIEKANSKYILFLKNLKNTTEKFFPSIIEKIKEDFDTCFLNYTIEIDGKVLSTEKLDVPEINKKPYIGDYIWCYIWNKDKFLALVNAPNVTRESIDTIIINTTYIEDVVYNHIPSQRIIENFIYTDEKKIKYLKNVFYMGSYCNGQFNGYITWLNNLGRCFSNLYEMSVLYDKIYEPTKKAFERYFSVIEREENTLYCCDRLVVTYSTYYYPKNILCLEENYMFIHGNMSDYENVRKYKYDNYTKYFGVSKVSAEKAHGYFPTDNIDYILNPIKIDQSEVKPHLKLVSAQRSDPIKKGERVHIISAILDEENIPYTWNVFTDKKLYDHSVYGGVIYRPSVQNVLPYTNDADYYVQLSDSEAYCYSVVEALALNTKVILTPLDCYKELNIPEEQRTYIPFEYFKPENKSELRELILKLYKEKDKPVKNQISDEMFKGYLDILKK